MHPLAVFSWYHVLLVLYTCGEGREHPSTTAFSVTSDDGLPNSGHSLYPFVGLDCIPFRSSSWPCAICVVMHLVVVSIVCVAKLYMVHLNRGKYQLTYYRYFMETIVYSILHVCTHLHITCKLYGEFKLFWCLRHMVHTNPWRKGHELKLILGLVLLQKLKIKLHEWNSSRIIIWYSWPNSKVLLLSR